MQKLSAKALAIPLILATVFNLTTIAKARAETPANTLTVTGRGDRGIPTTKARVRIEVEVEAKTAQEAQSEVARRSSAVITELKNLKVDKLQTTNISLNPKIVFEDNKQRQVGFTAQISMSFVTSNDRSGIAIDRAIAAGANRVIQITFSAEDEAIRAARNTALQDAVKNAQLQANAVLNSLNLKAQSIRTIQINGDSSPAFDNITNARLNSVSDSSTSIVGGEQRVEASVTLEITY